MNSNEVLQKITDNIYTKLNDNQRDEDVKLIIYMDESFHQRLMMEISRTDFSSSQAWDFSDRSSIMGYPVFRVIPQFTREGMVRHPDYEIAIV